MSAWLAEHGIDGKALAQSLWSNTGNTDACLRIVERAKAGAILGIRDGMPKRIQRKRTKGWRMPENTVYVGRPSAWGNPWPVGRHVRFSGGVLPVRVRTPAQAVAIYEMHATEPNLRERAIKELRGKNLACWCPLDQPCHADVLLRLANQEVKERT